MKVVALIQARSGSTRLPGKIFAGLPRDRDPELLMHVVRRVRRTGVDETLLVIPENDARLLDWAREKHVPFFAGSELDVRQRYRRAAVKTGADAVLRATGDNPCVDVRYAAAVVDWMRAGQADLVAFDGLPLGVGVEAFTAAALSADISGGRPAWDEHVSLHIKENPANFKIERRDAGLVIPQGLLLPRLTVDTPEDLAVVRRVFLHLGPDFSVEDVIELAARAPSMFEENRNIEQVRP